jgi:hypothetical protein
VKKLAGQWPVGAQLLGGLAVVAGIALLWGLAVALLVGGGLAVAVGYLFEGRN